MNILEAESKRLVRRFWVELIILGLGSLLIGAQFGWKVGTATFCFGFVFWKPE